MDAKATQALSRFNLDFDGTSVSAVSLVDGRPAGFRSRARSCVITPADAIRDGKKFSATVSYTSGPYLYTPDFNNFPIGILPFGWFSTQDGSVIARAARPGRTRPTPSATTRRARPPTPS